MSALSGIIHAGRPRFAALGRDGLSPVARVEAERWVRSVAGLIGREERVPVPRGLVDYIVATSDYTQSREVLAARTESMVQHALTNPPGIKFHSATREQIQVAEKRLCVFCGQPTSRAMWKRRPGPLK